MILQALNDYYERKCKHEPNTIPPVGFEENAILFVVILDGNGNFVNLEDSRIVEGKTKHGKPQLVPQSKDRPGKDAPFRGPWRDGDTRGLYVFKHDSQLGNAHAHSLFARIQAKLKDGIAVPRTFEDYSVLVDGTLMKIREQRSPQGGVTLTRMA
jgi:CRISPR-associated protein (Cas_Csd1).